MRMLTIYGIPCLYCIMALFEFHVHQTIDSSGIQKKLDLIIKQNTNMAKNLADLSAKADELQAALDTVQAKVQENTTTLQAEIQELKDIIAAGGSGAEVDAVFEKLDATLLDLNSTFPATP